MTERGLRGATDPTPLLVTDRGGPSIHRGRMEEEESSQVGEEGVLLLLEYVGLRGPVEIEGLEPQVKGVVRLSRKVVLGSRAWVGT